MNVKESFPIYQNSDLQVSLDPKIFANQHQLEGTAKAHEYLMLDIIKKTFNLDQEFIAGNVKLHEPDFVNSEFGIAFEMTFVDKRERNSVIYGIKTNGTINLIDKDVIEWMIVAAATKASKKANSKYSVKSIYLVMMLPIPIEIWTYDKCILDSNKLSKTFYDLNQKYVQSNTFEDIFIINPAPSEKMTVYKVSNYNDLEHFVFPETIDWDDDRYNVL